MSSLIQRIDQFNAGLIKNKVEIKYRFMAEDAYRFFRGTCHLFFEDLSKAPPLPPSPHVWMCGDLHVENLGSFKGDNRLVYFDLNDFDEAALGPVTWELVRMTTSIFVAFGHLKIEHRKAFKWANLFLNTYSKTLAEGKAKFVEARTAKGIIKKFLDSVVKRRQKELLKKHAHLYKNKLRLSTANEKMLKLKPELKKELITHIEHWLQHKDDSPYNYNVLDACFRIAGTGSVGANRFVFLLQSRRNKGEHLLLEMKEATPSSLMPFINVQQPEWASEAERITSIQKRVQMVSPALLSTTVFKDASYVLEEMQPSEDKVDFRQIRHRYRYVCEVISEMASMTSSAHFTSSGRQGSAIADELIAFGKRNDWQQSLIEYSIQYAEQVKSNYAEFANFFKEKI